MPSRFVIFDKQPTCRIVAIIITREMKYFLDERNLSPFRFRIKSILKIDIINIIKFLRYV